MYEGHDGDASLVGAYVAPRSCEYCGASTTTLCPASCTRPKLYFRRQKPPFESPDRWDPVTEYELPPEEEPLPPPQPAQRSSSWVSELFGVKSSWDVEVTLDGKGCEGDCEWTSVLYLGNCRVMLLIRLCEMLLYCFSRFVEAWRISTERTGRNAMRIRHLARLPSALSSGTS